MTDVLIITATIAAALVCGAMLTATVFLILDSPTLRGMQPEQGAQR